jgi:hypothetical protein
LSRIFGELAERPGKSELFAAVVVGFPRSEAAKHLRGEGFVDFPGVDVVQRQPMPLQDRRRRMHRTEAHLRRVEARPLAVADLAERLQPPFVDRLLEARISHAAPSVICELLPGVTRPYFLSKKGFSLARAAMLESARTPSSSA